MADDPCTTIREAAGQLKHDALKLDLDGLAALLADAESTYSLLREAVDTVRTAAKDAMSDADVKRYEAEGLPGVLCFTKKNAKPRWDDGRALARRIAGLAVDKYGHDAEGVAVPVAVVGEKVADEIAAVIGADNASGPAWRKKAITGRKIPLDDYYHEEGGEWTVRFDTQPRR